MFDAEVLRVEIRLSFVVSLRFCKVVLRELCVCVCVSLRPKKGGCFGQAGSTCGYGSKNRLDRPAVIRTSGTRGLRKGA